MALPLVPLAAAAMAVLALARAARPVRIDQRAEDSLDALDEGLGLSHLAGRGQTSGSARLRRVIRLGATGPGIEIDAGLLARLRVRRV